MGFCSFILLEPSVKNDVTIDAIKAEIKKQATSCRKGLIHFHEDKMVSSDFIGSQYSAIVDFNQIQVIDKFITIGAWYDNEMGYSSRVLDLVKCMIDVDQQKEK